MDKKEMEERRLKYEKSINRSRKIRGVILIFLIGALIACLGLAFDQEIQERKTLAENNFPIEPRGFYEKNTQNETIIVKLAMGTEKLQFFRGSVAYSDAAVVERGVFGYQDMREAVNFKDGTSISFKVGENSPSSVQSVVGNVCEYVIKGGSLMKFHRLEPSDFPASIAYENNTSYAF